MASAAEIRFHQLLQVLARSANFQLDEITLGLYDAALSQFGYGRVNSAIQDIFTERRGGDRFPSIADIKDKMGMEVSPRAQAIAAVGSIFFALNRWGARYNHLEDFEEQFRTKIGDLPWEVCERMGGYRALYQEWNECRELGTLRAQLREVALATIELTKAETAALLTETGSVKQIGGRSEEVE